MKNLGNIVFLVGLLLAIIIALFSSVFVPVWAVYVIAIIGILVGLFNVTAVETRTFLIASVAFLISFQALSSVFTALAFGWTAVSTFFNLLSVFVAPAAAIVAVKALYGISKEV